MNKLTGAILAALAIIVLVFGWRWYSSEWLFSAVSMGNVDTVRTLLGLRPGLVNSWNDAGRTPLALAVNHGEPEMVRLLLEKGADVNGDCAAGLPLNNAAWDGNLSVVELLLTAGASVEGQSQVSDNERNLGTPLHLAAMHGETEVVARLLRAGANVNSRSRRRSTPLHASVQTPHVAADKVVRTVRLLLDHGADVNARDSDGHTPLYWADFNERPEIASLIRSDGGRE